MDVSQHIRSTGGVTFRQEDEALVTTKRGNFGIADIIAPDRVSSGEPIDIETIVFNGLSGGPNLWLSDDPDVCSSVENDCEPPIDSGVGDTAGFCYTIETSAKWAQPKDTTDCLNGNIYSVPTETIPHGIIAPVIETTEKLIFTVTLRHPGSGVEKKVNKAITVVGTESDSCTTDSDCPQGRICSGGLCIEPGETCSSDSDCDEGEVCENGACVPSDDGGNGDGGSTDPFVRAQRILIGLAVLAVVLQVSGD